MIIGYCRAVCLVSAGDLSIKYLSPEILKHSR